MYYKGGSFAILDMHALPLTLNEQILIFLAFLAAFAVKVPMWPVHTWLPDAHVEAPTGGSVILAAIMLKIGGYGFIRFSMPITPDASQELDWLIIFMSLVAIVYIGFVALVQRDMKKLVAYSSIAHMGFVTLGLFVVFQIWENPENVSGSGAAMAVEGAMIQMISHGFISGAMYMIVCIPVKLQLMVVLYILCPCLLVLLCFLPWRTPDCQEPRVLLESSWSLLPVFTPIFGMPSSPH